MRRLRRDHASGQLVWVLVWLSGGITLSFFPDNAALASGSSLAVGLLVGWFWQLRSRRDLTDRLTSVIKVYAVLLAIGLLGLLGLLIGGSVEFGSDDGPGSDLAYWLGIVIALVLTEQWLRRLDRQEADAREEAESGDQVVA